MKKTGILVLFVLLLIACSPRDKGQAEGSVKDFTLTALNGEDYTLSKLRGQVVLIDFWATWCPPCRRSIPVFVSLYEKYRDRGFIVLGISREEKSKLVDFKNSNNVSYPILIDNKDVSQAYGVTAIPSIFILDKKGVIQKTQVGFAPELEAEFDTLIDSLLKE